MSSVTDKAAVTHDHDAGAGSFTNACQEKCRETPGCAYANVIETPPQMWPGVQPHTFELGEENSGCPLFDDFLSGSDSSLSASSVEQT